MPWWRRCGGECTLGPLRLGLVARCQERGLPSSPSISPALLSSGAQGLGTSRFIGCSFGVQWRLTTCLSQRQADERWERLLGSQRGALAVGGKRQVCAASEGRLRRGSRERGRGLGRAGGKGVAGLVHGEEGEDRDEKGMGSVSPGWSLRLVPGTVPGVSSALPTWCRDRGLPAPGPPWSTLLWGGAVR